MSDAYFSFDKGLEYCGRRFCRRIPNGRPKPPAYMNCVGFVSAVITDAGGDVSPIANYRSPISGYHRDNDTNASMWQGWTYWNSVEMYHYGSKEEMLASGILEKGDIIYMHPFETVDPTTNDCHIGIFWGDSPTDDKFWHSSSHGDGLIVGTQPDNMISKITPKSPTYWCRVLKTRKTTFVHVGKNWAGDGDYLGRRPESVRFTVTGSDGSSRELVVHEADGYEGEIRELPLGVVYSVSEAVVPGYECLISQVDAQHFNVTNNRGLGVQGLGRQRCDRAPACVGGDSLWDSDASVRPATLSDTNG